MTPLEPVHEHDCNVCIFLGQDGPLPGEPKCNVVDLYICTQGRTPDNYALIRRYSSEGGDYGCWTYGVKSASSRYNINEELARAKGIV